MPGAGLSNIHDYTLTSWDPEHGLDPDNVEEHARYIDRICDDFERVMRDSIEQGGRRPQMAARPSTGDYRNFRASA